MSSKGIQITYAKLFDWCWNLMKTRDLHLLNLQS